MIPLKRLYWKAEHFNLVLCKHNKHVSTQCYCSVGKLYFKQLAFWVYCLKTSCDHFYINVTSILMAIYYLKSHIFKRVADSQELCANS